MESDEIRLGEIKYRQARGEGDEYICRVREILLSHLWRFENPFRTRRLRSVCATVAKPGRMRPRAATIPDSMAQRKKRIRARGELQRAFGKASKNRPLPRHVQRANPVLPPRERCGSDVQPGDIRPEKGCPFALLLPVERFLFSILRHRRKPNQQSCRRPWRSPRADASIRTNLSVTVISRWMLALWVRGKFVCLSPLIGGDETTDGKNGGKRPGREEEVGRGNHFTYEKSRQMRRTCRERTERKVWEVIEKNYQILCVYTEYVLHSVRLKWN